MNKYKYICKIISILIKNRFKDITKTEENAFISKFLIEKLLVFFLKINIKLKKLLNIFKIKYF